MRGAIARSIAIVFRLPVISFVHSSVVIRAASSPAWPAAISPA